jgi:PKD repeat protein
VVKITILNKSIISVIIVLVILNLSIFTSLNIHNSKKTIIEHDLSIDQSYKMLPGSTDDTNTNCAGGIATGTVVKNGRNIFWKNRHMTGENEKPRFEHGPVYDYWMNSGGTWGMNEVGLALGNFAQSGTLDNWGFYSDATYGQTYPIQSYLLGHFDNVYDAALFAAQHMGGKSTLGIVGAEPGVGAVVYSGVNPQGQQVCNLTWVNNSYMALANAYECDDEYDDAKWYDAQGRLDDSYNTHGYIDWADVIQKGARDVKGREEGSGAFTACCVSKPPSLSSIIAVSGDPRWNGAANIAWTCLARQPLVGIYVPLGASYLQYTDESDIPTELTYGLYGGGMEDYVDAKVNYATNGGGQGSSTYYAEKVREIQDYAFQIENYSFILYDAFMNSIHTDITQETIEAMLKNYVNTIIPEMIDAYVNESYIYQDNIPPITDFSYSPTTPTIDDIIDFIDFSSDSDGSIVNWTWNFGDGTNSYEQNPMHQYTYPLSYNVCLTIADDDGATNNVCKDLIVIGVDINQSIYDRGFPIRSAEDGDWAAAQSFQSTMNSLHSVDIYLRKFGTPEFNLIIEIREDHPQGPLLDSSMFIPDEVPSSWEWHTVDFNDFITTSGKEYFIVCQPAPGGVTTNFGYEWAYAFGNHYNDGSFWFTRDGGSLWRDLSDNYEFTFKTHGLM